MPKQRNNHGAAPCPNEDRAVEQAFFRLGNVLAEIAEDIEREKANIGQDTAGNGDGIGASQSETRKGPPAGK